MKPFIKEKPVECRTAGKTLTVNVLLHAEELVRCCFKVFLFYFGSFENIPFI